MYKVQFNTVIDGDIIHIPEQYRDHLRANSNVKIIAVSSDYKEETGHKKFTNHDFTALNIPDVYKFDREEANER